MSIKLVSDVKQVLLPPPLVHCLLKMRQIIIAFYRSVKKAKKNNAFEYFFHSIVEKNKLSESHSFSFLIYLALRVKNIIC